MAEANRTGIMVLGPIMAVMICAAAMIGVAVMHEPSSAQVAADAEGVPIGEVSGQSHLQVGAEKKDFYVGATEQGRIVFERAKALSTDTEFIVRESMEVHKDLYCGLASDNGIDVWSHPHFIKH